MKRGIKFEIKSDFDSDCIAATIQTSHGPIIVMTSYIPPRRNALPHQDFNYMIRNNTPTIMMADLNARHQMFGYNSASNMKGNQLRNHIFNNRLNYIGPHFNTYYTLTSETKPDCVLTNN